MIKLDGDLVRYYWDPNNPKTQRILERIEGPKRAANDPSKPKPPTPDSDKPKPASKLEDTLVGTWNGGSGGRFDEYWTITHDGMNFRVTATYW
jgi:hypothetical protein